MMSEHFRSLKVNMMNKSRRLQKQITLICLLAFNLGILSAQHTVFPDLIIWGEDQLPQFEQADTSIIFDLSSGGVSGGTKSISVFTPWDRDSIGRSSFAYGETVIASGSTSVAFGSFSRAGGGSSMATGSSTIASGFNSTAMGSSSEASGAFGATALGHSTEASGNNGATALGRSTEASGDNGATALGFFTRAQANSGTALGQYNDPLVEVGYNGSDKPLFIVGNGTSFLNRSNAMVVRQDGEIEFSNYKFPIDNGTSGQILTTTSSGQLTWREANNSFECPAGYAEVANFCIEVDVNGAGEQNLQSSIEMCADEGAQMPTYQQFYLAVDAGVLNTTSGINRRHWMSDLVFSTAIRGTTGLEEFTGPQSINVSAQNPAADFYFRCVIEK